MLALYQWARTVTGLPVIWAMQNAPRPAMPYLALQVIDTQFIGEDYMSKPDDEGDITLTGNMEMVLQCQCFGGEPMETMTTMRHSLQKPTVLSTLQEAGWAAILAHPIQTITALNDSQFESRASCDFVFRKGLEETDHVGIINQVSGTGFYLDATGQISQEHDYEVIP